MATSHLLDTTVLLHWTRDSPQARAIDQQFQLTASPMRPLICEVSLGEMRAFSRSLNWRAAKLKRLADIEGDVVVVRIGDPRVLDAYADLSTLAKSKGWALFLHRDERNGSVVRKWSDLPRAGIQLNVSRMRSATPQKKLTISEWVIEMEATLVDGYRDLLRPAGRGSRRQA